MKKHIIIFGGSSFLAKELYKNYKKKKIKLSSFSKKKIPTIFKTNYGANSIQKILSKRIKNNEKPIFIFFNSIADRLIFKNYNEKDIRKIIEVNVLQPIIITNKLINEYFFQKPKFIFISSSRALKGDKGIVLYSTSKNAIRSFSKNLAMEYGNYNITSKVVNLGLFDGGLKNKLSKNSNNQILDRTFNKKYVNVSQFIKTIEFTIEDDSGNGSEIFCDNGYV